MEIKMSEVGGIRDGVRCGKRRDKVNGWWEARGKYICVYIYIYIYKSMVLSNSQHMVLWVLTFRG